MSYKKHKTLKSLCLYGLCIFWTIICMFPVLYAVLLSFRSNNEIFAYALPFSIHTILPVQWTMDNFIAIFRDYNIEIPLINSLILSAVAIPCSILINGLSAFSFAVFKFKGKGILLGLFMLSFMIPFDAISIPLYRLVNSLGWVNTRMALIVPGMGNGLVMLLFIQFFRGIPSTLLDAARIDGAGWLKVFFKIILPLCVPVCITAGLMVFMEHWNSYMWPLLVARNDNVRTIQIALSDFRTEYETMWSYIFAASSITLILPLALFFPFQKYYVQGITHSGIKG